MEEVQHIFVLDGLHCAACAARVETAVTKLDGVSRAEVNPVAGLMRVRHDAKKASAADIAAAVERAGFHAELREPTAPAAQAAKPSCLPWVVSAIILIPLLALHYHCFSEEDYPLVELCLLLPIVALNYGYFTRGLRALLHAAPNMDTLVALGAATATIYSIADVVHLHSGHAYADSAAMILTIVSFGLWLESRCTAGAGNALAALRRRMPTSATILRNGGQESIPTSQIMPGDTLLVKPGALVPADGTVLEGVSEIDESTFTGESTPLTKKAGSKVFAGTVNGSAPLTITAASAPGQSAISRIIRLVGEAEISKPGLARLADRLAAWFVPAAILIAVVTILVWSICTGDVSFALRRGISVLVISCPCALGLATPIAVMAAAGRAAREGIIFRNGHAMETAWRATVAVLDKTGTLTRGRPQVVATRPVGISDKELLQLASALEGSCNHPYAAAVCAALPADEPNPFRAQDIKNAPGRGVQGLVNGQPCAAGSISFMKELGIDTAAVDLWNIPNAASPLYVARNGTLCGMIAVADTLRESSTEAVKELRHLGLRTIMVTGDCERTAAAVARQCGIDDARWEMPPQRKVELVKELQAAGEKVMMVGDGINDTPALTAADVSMTVGMGTDAALNSADIILAYDDLINATDALKLSRKLTDNIKNNLTWAAGYNIVAIPLAAGAFYPLFHWTPTPAFAAACMCASSLCVVLSALRLRGSDHNTSDDGLPKVVSNEGY